MEQGARGREQGAGTLSQGKLATNQSLSNWGSLKVVVYQQSVVEAVTDSVARPGDHYCCISQRDRGSCCRAAACPDHHGAGVSSRWQVRGRVRHLPIQPCQG